MSTTLHRRPTPCCWTGPLYKINEQRPPPGSSETACRACFKRVVERMLQHGIHTTRTDLEWFAQGYWAQSIDLKCRFGWQPPSAEDLPRRVYEALSLSLERTPEELQSLMEMLIEEWKRQAGETLARFGYEVAW